MAENDALVLEYSHLRRLPREREALLAIRKIASLVKHIMRARNWKVGTLAEFYPDEQNLLGINVNRGQKICLRLRYPGDKNQFLPMEQVVDTMLHELSHNVHGPHDAKFHALWNQLRKEYEGLLSKGYTGEGFLSDGHVVGGRRVPRDEARRIARAAAEKRRTLYSGSGQKLGGAPVRAGTDIRRVIVDAIERRNTVLKGCGSERKSAKEIIDLTDDALNNGFRTKAEEDEANELAISQALWELVQEDQKNEYGDLYIPSSPANPTGNGGGEVRPGPSIKREASPSPASPSRSRTAPDRQPQQHMSRLVAENERQAARKSNATFEKEADIKQTETDSNLPSRPPPLAAPTGWTCSICTLHNPIDFLCCDACTTQRPEEITIQLAQEAKKVRTSQPTGVQTDIWQCHVCTTTMESEWWTCSTCGTMKQSS